eukprot:3907068-Pyramimonas_sp.AAC.1
MVQDKWIGTKETHRIIQNRKEWFLRLGGPRPEHLPLEGYRRRRASTGADLYHGGGCRARKWPGG